MARLLKFVLMLVSGVGVSLTASTEVQAGVIPWVYDAIFGPPGSMRYASSYGSMSSGYGNRGYSSAGYYGAYGASYAPMSYTPVASGYGNSCGCSQSSSYAPMDSYGYAPSNYAGSSSGCSSGNCSNCSTGTSTSAGYPSTPSPDPNYNTRDSLERLNQRLRHLEDQLKYHGDYLKNKHEDFKGLNSLQGSSRSEVEEPVHSRPIGSGLREETIYTKPSKARRKLTDETDTEQIEAQKPTLPTTKDLEKATEDKKSNPSNTDGPVIELPKTERETTSGVVERDVEARGSFQGLTARAVVPRQRFQSQKTPANANAVNVAATKSAPKNPQFVLDSSLSQNVSRH